MKLQPFLVFLILSSYSITHATYGGTDDAPKQKPYFIEVPIAKLSTIQCPCINVEIDDVQYPMELDLGFHGDLSVEEEHINSILEKQFIYNRTTRGIRGKKYSNKVFRIPRIKIGKMSFLKPSAQQGNTEFNKDSIFGTDENESSSKEAGRLGWKLFQKVNLLIDIKNNKIVFCDSINTLLKHDNHYSINNFVKTPLTFHSGFIQLSVDTAEKTLHCILDTGATWNILNREFHSDKSLDEAVWDPQNVMEIPFFKINGEEFGPLTFHCMPISLPICVDAILGMEFFKKHLVFLDFREKQAYILKNNR